MLRNTILDKAYWAVHDFFVDFIDPDAVDSGLLPHFLYEEIMNDPAQKKHWWLRAARRSAERGTYRVIYEREEVNPYLARFYLHPRWWTLGLFRVVLHKFIRSDQEIDGLHDHPWPYISIPLSGGYYEWMMCKPSSHAKTCQQRFYRSRFWPILARAGRKHRVELTRSTKWLNAYQGRMEEDQVWTLFIMGPRIRKWNFYIPTPSGWRKYFWKDWLKTRADPEIIQKRYGND